MKARPVTGMRPKRTLRENGARIVEVRLDELFSFDPAIRDVANVRELHDMRIAAKRLRYVLELTGFCFGAEGKDGERIAKELQELLGEIHDCDVLVPLVDDHVGRLRQEDAADLIAAVGPGGWQDLAATVGRAPNRTRYRGLELFAAQLLARRALLYDAFLVRWDELLRDGWRARLEGAL